MRAILTRRTALARARRGAAFLDENVPGWREKVEADHLDMEIGYFDSYDPVGCGCVLAQIGATDRDPGDYSDAARDLGLDPDGVAAKRLGFHVPEIAYTVDDSSYEVLTAAWQAVIRESA